MNEEPKSELMAEFERLMDSPEVLRYFQVLSLIQEEEKKVKISAPSLAQYMKFRRQQLGMNQLEYAKHLGWQKGAVKQIENGSRLNMKRAKRLFKDGYSVDMLFS